MNHRHEERYKRAIARITPEQRERATARALKELGYVAMPKNIAAYHEIESVERLIAIKLGLRWSDARPMKEAA